MSLAFCVLIGHSKSENMQNLDTISKNKPLVILDAGHGGLDPVNGNYVTSGKRSPIWPDGSVYYEGVGNRKIVKVASDLLLEKGIDTVFTVDPENHLDVSLSKRVKIANKHYLDSNKNAFLISVHSNGYKKESAHGTEVFTSHGETKSDKVATSWMQEFKSMFPEIRQRTDFDDNDIDKEAKFTIIHKTLCPAILIESMFHTNYKESKMLMDPLVRKRIAKVICNTVEKVIEQNLV